MTSASGKSCYGSARSRADGRQAARHPGRGMRRPGRTARGGDLGRGQRSCRERGACHSDERGSIGGYRGGAPLDGAGRLLSSMALGLNTAPWDGIYAADVGGGGVDTLEPLLRAADVGLLRYGGGSYADYYGWETDSNIGNCLPNDATASFVVTGGGCATSDALDFDQLPPRPRRPARQNLVPLNSGSGPPAEAAAWVTQSVSTPGDKVALWEVGNETYGCWEVDNWLARAPENYQGYTINEEPDVSRGDAGRGRRNSDAGDLLCGQRPGVHAGHEEGGAVGPDRRALGLRQRRPRCVRAEQRGVEQHGAGPRRQLRQLRGHPLLPVLLWRQHRRRQPDRPAGAAVPAVGARALRWNPRRTGRL